MAERDPDVPHPRLNPYLIGHEAAERDYLRAWSGGRLAHAWLIGGARGIGKATLAYRMARYALTQRDGAKELDMFGAPPPVPNLSMSGEDPVFRRVAALGHGDFRAIERGWSDAKQTKRRASILVEDVREIGGFLSMTPSEGGWRVVIIDAADEMNSNAANAVLKVLEEPPRRALLFLIAHNPDRLLPTIRSRCRRVDLRPLTDAQVAALLNRYQPSLAPADVSALAQLADGSIGRALELAEEGGVELFRELMSLMGDLPRLNITRLHALADKAARGEAFRTLADLLSWWLARMVALGERDALGSVAEIADGERALVSRLRAAAPAGAWAETWTAINQLTARTDGLNLDRKRSLMSMAMRIEATAQGRAVA
ncbi:MAG: DNA polymerase III subunit delta' [Rhodospirillaceae bacterium]|nr:MAG: DNA polymerase III subunit delta' [Rhodospirillaceae bacterium]